MAGPFYLRSTDGSDASDGLTWANAKATLAGAFAVAAAGERIWVSQVHAETQAASMTATSAGTPAALVEVLCGNDAAQPPTALTTGATISVTGAFNLDMSGYTYFYGIQFNTGSAANVGLIQLAGAPHYLVFEACKFHVLGTATTSRIVIGTVSTLANHGRTVWLNCTMQISQASQGINANGGFRWEGGSLTLGTVPTAGLLATGAGTRPNIWVRGVDLTNVGANALVNVGTAMPAGFIQIEHCKLEASATLTMGTSLGPGMTYIAMENCDSADTQYRMHRHRYEGDVYSETVIVRTGGASNGTTPLSHKMVSSATCTLHTPLYGPDLVIWNDTTGSSKTATVEMVHDSVTALTDAEVWLEVEYLGTSGTPLSLFVKDRKATVLATAVDQTTSSVAWTTTGLTNVNKQKLAVTFTPQEIGLIRARVALAKASYTGYVDPLLTVA